MKYGELETRKQLRKFRKKNNEYLEGWRTKGQRRAEIRQTEGQEGENISSRDKIRIPVGATVGLEPRSSEQIAALCCGAEINANISIRGPLQKGRGGSVSSLVGGASGSQDRPPPL